MSYLVRDVNPDSDADMQQLAEMFNDFDNAWPGGFTRGIPATVARVRDQIHRDTRLAILIVEGDGMFLGFCDLKAQTGDTDRAYIPTLGARLSHHGKGIGKILLREMVRRVAEQGFRELTLGTWAGNTKAVPLYKKTGFNWVPETNVWMRNFLPALLNLPQGKAFFADRDWYLCHERNIVVEHDDVTWKGMKVYTYQFRDGNEYLNAIFDNASGGMTAIETTAYAVACSVATEDGAAGETYPITWEIESRNGKPLEVVLLTETDDGLEVKAQERMVVTGEARITRDLRVSSNAKPRGEGERAHRVRTTLLLNGEPLVLETGVKVVRPVEITFGGMGLIPGRADTARVTLRNNLEREVSGALVLDAHPALDCATPVQEFTLPPRFSTDCEFALTAKESGLHLSRLTIEAGETRVTRPVAFAAPGLGTFGWVDEDYSEQATLRSSDLKGEVTLRGGQLALFDADGQRSIDQAMAQIGPPFPGWRLRPPVMPTRAETSGGQAALITVSPSEELPGLVVERTVTLLNGDLAKVQYRVRNTTAQALATKLRVHTESEFNGWIAAPTPDGLIHEPMRAWGEFPQDDNDLIEDGKSFTESWIALEEAERVCGLIWQEPVVIQTSWNRIPDLVFDLGEVAPYAIKEIAPVYVIAGNGDWKTVRAHWQRLMQSSDTFEAMPPETVRVQEVRAEPSMPALITAESPEVNIAVINRRGKPITGRLTLKSETLSPEPAELSLEKVERGKPFAATVRVAVSERPSAGFLETTLEHGANTLIGKIPIVNLGSGRGVSVTEPEAGIVSLDNGSMTLRFAPAFLGAMIALERDGVNHLHSAYPQSRPFVWANPWFGGVHPFLGWWMGEDALMRESFSGGPCERTGTQGFRWTGVRMACEPTHKDRRWLRIETDYLTLPGSNLIAVETRFVNKATARMEIQGGVALWGQPGGTRENEIAHWEREGERKQYRRGGFGVEASSSYWAALENATTGDALLLVSASPRSHIHLEDMQEEGAHLGTVVQTKIEPGATLTCLSYIALCHDLKGSEAYLALKSLRELP